MKTPRIKTILLDKIPMNERPKVTSSKDAFTLLNEHYDQDTISLYESAYVMLINRNSRVIGVEKIGEGGTSMCIFDTLRIMQSVVCSGALYFIISHNHPSGNTKPSAADIETTKKIRDAANLLHVNLLDHIIVTEHDGYYSFADEGALY